MSAERLAAAKDYLSRRGLHPGLRRPGGSAVLASWQGPAAARRTDAQTRAFAAAQLSRLTDSWIATRDEIHQELKGDLDRLRARARQLENDNDFAARYLEMVETNIVGDTGPRLRSTIKNENGTPDKLAREAVEGAWEEWGRRGACVASGDLSFLEWCWHCARGTARDGEYLVYELLGADAENRFGYAIKIIDVERIATWLNREPSPGLNAIRLGIEYDGMGRPVNFHITSGSLSSRSTTVIPADRVIHRYRAKRAHQGRGVTWMHASMLSMHYVGEFALSALLAAKHGADHLGFFVSPDGEPPVEGKLDAEGNRIVTTAPGTYDTLPSGWDVKTVDSKYPNEVFDPFVKSANRRMASGLNVSYPALCNDHADLNYNSIRATQSDDRDQWRKYQAWFREAWLETIFARWFQFAMANKAIVIPNGAPLPIAKFTKFSAHAWQFRGWESNDPKQDIEAFILERDNFVDSATSYAARKGRDIEDVIDEIAHETAAASALPQPAQDPKKPPSTAPQKETTQ